ncbi:MAG: ATP synthase F1 subunit delta [Bacteroidetes bacterium RIFCSPHIGHO2_02_FULL_44_7]|nr:MAG: ATP synthase F1 subunit delta [Bacteroidetes bacterium RIFCSPHIGHO2_02_FULL_44_7]
MKRTKAAARYAKALLELAIEQNKVDGVLGDMQFLAKTSEETREFELLIASPIIHPDKKISIFEMVFEQFETVSLSFVRLITKNRREAHLPAIAEAFEALVKEYKGIVPITVFTATPMDAGTRDLLIEKIQASVEGTLEVTEKIDESLIGGFIVRMGDVQIDASVSSQFNNLKQRLTR